MSRVAWRHAFRPGLFQAARTSTHPAPSSGGRQLGRRAAVAILIAVLAVEAAVVAPPQALGAQTEPPSPHPLATDGTDTDASGLEDPREAEPVEVPALRTLDSRTFQNPDGTYTSEYFPSPIHFEDASGDLKVIDTEAVDSAADGIAFETKRAPVDTRLGDYACAECSRTPR